MDSNIYSYRSLYIYVLWSFRICSLSSLPPQRFVLKRYLAPPAVLALCGVVRPMASFVLVSPGELETCFW